MNNAIILGCSHAAGAEIMHTPNLDTAQCTAEFEAQNSYPALLSKHLGYTPHNHAISGGSNDAMFRIFVEQLENLSGNDIVIACWSGFDRGEVWHEQHQYWIPINYDQGTSWQRKPNPVLLQGVCDDKEIVNEKEYNNYGKQWLMFEGNEHRGRLNKIKNILALNALAKSKNVKVININSFMSVLNFEWPNDIYWPKEHSKQHPIELEFTNWAAKNNYYHTSGGHFLLPAHQAYAQYLFECITKDSII